MTTPLDLVKELRGAVDQLQAQGHFLIPAPELSRSLRTIENALQGDNSAQTAQELVKAANIKVQTESYLDTIRSIVPAAHTAVNILLITNGGAAVAILALLGNIWKEIQGKSISTALTHALLLFGGGVVFAAICSVSIYFNLYSLASASEGWARFFRIVAIMVWFVSATFFATGCWRAYEAFRSPLMQPNLPLNPTGAKSAPAG